VSGERFPRVASFKTADAFRRHLATLGIPLQFDNELARPEDSPLGKPMEVAGVRVGNRFCILPMEGWDGTRDGRPSELTIRRWKHFGLSGAKLIWGGEAVAVRHDGRANPNQLLLVEETKKPLADLREALVREHVTRFGPRAADDLYIGLQLTHSGRFARPDDDHQAAPLVAYRHPVLDRRFPAGVRTLSDDDLDRLVVEFVGAARMAYDIGFQFVDIKHCHGYLGHELLTATDRPGPFGGPFDARLTFLRRIVEGIRAEAPGLGIGVRLSAFDAVPYRKNASDVGTPEIDDARYHHAFGPLQTDHFLPSLDDARAFLRALEALQIDWVCLTAGSPYYNPHIQRPALFPPSGGYLPPEDPLVGVARQIAVVGLLKREFQRLAIAGSGYSYLQEWLPHVGQAAVREGLTDFVGLGRMVLSYPELPADVLAGKPLKRQSICRTFSDCTSGPRNGLVSGCFPLDPFYKAHADAEKLKALKEHQTTR
jgi:NADPH2 dehydrogenase